MCVPPVAGVRCRRAIPHRGGHHNGQARLPGAELGPARTAGGGARGGGEGGGGRGRRPRDAALVVPDHVVTPRRIESRYPYNATGRIAVPPDADYLEPLAMLCFLAGATSRIRFGPSVLVLPYRNPP